MPFERTFSHRDWVDGEDLVQAGSSPHDDGFNVRFHQIEDDLDALGRYVNGTVLGQQEVSFVPRFAAVYEMGGRWGLSAFFPPYAGASGQAYGILSLELPDRVRLISFSMRGRASDNPVECSLRRRIFSIETFVDGHLGDVLAFSDEEAMGEGFALSYPILAGENEENIVDNSTYQYFLYAFYFGPSAAIYSISVQYDYDLES